MKHKKHTRLALVFFAIILIAAVCVACTPDAEAPPPAPASAPIITPEAVPEPAGYPLGATDEALQSLIDSFFDMTKRELIEKYGLNYHVTYTGAEGLMRGIRYDALGLTFTFGYGDGDDDDLLMWIDCDASFRIYGAGPGMTFEEVMARLGEAEVTEFFIETPDHPAYAVTYQLGRSRYEFASMAVNGGTWLTIYADR